LFVIHFGETHSHQPRWSQLQTHDDDVSNARRPRKHRINKFGIRLLFARREHVSPARGMQARANESQSARSNSTANKDDLCFTNALSASGFFQAPDVVSSLAISFLKTACADEAPKDKAREVFGYAINARIPRSSPRSSLCLRLTTSRPTTYGLLGHESDHRASRIDRRKPNDPAGKKYHASIQVNFLLLK